MNGQCCASRSRMLSDQFMSTPNRLPSIPEEEPFVIGENAVCDNIQAWRRAQSDDLMLWSHGELRKALHTLMQSEYAAPFTDAQSSSSMSLQAIEQRLELGKYANDLDLFWSDVETCWDTSAHICDTDRKSAHNQGSSAFIERFHMANKMRALTSELEMDFWNSLFALQHHSPDEDASLDTWGTGFPTAKEVLMDMDSWIMDATAGFAEWLFSKQSPVFGVLIYE